MAVVLGWVGPDRFQSLLEEYKTSLEQKALSCMLLVGAERVAGGGPRHVWRLRAQLSVDKKEMARHEVARKLAEITNDVLLNIIY
eukprot:747071-Hanusia_phi.AAC.3